VKLEFWSVDDVLAITSGDDDPDSAMMDMDDDGAIYEQWDHDLSGRDAMEQVLYWKRKDDSYHELVESMSKHGVLSPIGIAEDEDGWMLANGHHRLAAMIDLGYKEIPVLLADTWFDAWDSSEEMGGWGVLMPRPAQTDEDAL